MKKNTFTLLALILLGITQINTQVTVPDFTLTDINGNTYNLYTELAEGKTIVIDFFAVQCGSCQTGIAYAEDIWQTYGTNGDDLWVWAIETSGAAVPEVDDFVQVNGGSFPSFTAVANDSLASFFDITYTPQYFVICPNGFIKSCGVEQLGQYVESCPQLTSLTEEDAYSKQSVINSISSVNGIEVSFTSNSNSPIAFDLYDILGNKISHSSDFFPQGNNSITISSAGLARGYYFVRMFEAGEYVSTRKFVLP